MLLPYKGRKCWIVVDWWEEDGVAQGRIADGADGCIGWDICGSKGCRAVVVGEGHGQEIRFICSTADLHRTKGGAKRAIRRERKKRA